MSIAIIVALFGRVDDQADKLVSFISALNAKCKLIPLEIVFVCESSEWERFISRQVIKNKKNMVIHAPYGVARMFNIGANQTTSELCVFFTLMNNADAWFDILIKLYTSSVEHEFSISAPQCSYVSSSSVIDSTRPYSIDLPSEYQCGWLEMLDILPMHFSIVKSDVFRKLGGFIESVVMCSGFWWAFSLKAARNGEIICNKNIKVAVRDFPEVISWGFNIENPTPVSRDGIARIVCRNDSGYELSDQELIRIGGGTNTKLDGDQSSLIRVMVISGVNDTAHNQLCFFNFFQRSESKYKYVWRTALDSEVKSYELEDYDIVIFSRVKTDVGVQLAGYCQSQKIPSVYMLDDNWFSIADDWPEYRNIFSPGERVYDCFISCMLMCNVVLTYNRVLAEDIKKIHNNVMVLPTNIDLSIFHNKKNKKNKILVGYVGSTRKEDVAFRALSQIATLRDDFDIFVMSNNYPPSLSGVASNRVIFQPYVFGYTRYAEILCNMSPDVLLAPLSDARTDASKCPNKYLEITACGAIGIYSNVSPYTEVISDGDNGFLVNNDIDSWAEAINILIDSPSLLNEMASSAYSDVSENYATPAVEYDFFSFIKSTINNTK